jgi:hypothetical protein
VHTTGRWSAAFLSAVATVKPTAVLKPPPFTSSLKWRPSFP